MLQHDFGRAVALHADLGDFDLGRLRGREKDVVVGGVLRVLEELGDEMAAEMVAAAGGDVHGAEHFFVLDVAAGDGQVLRAEAEFADLAGDGIADAAWRCGHRLRPGRREGAWPSGCGRRSRPSARSCPSS